MALVAVSPKFLEPVGHYAPLVAGVTVMASGTATRDLSSKFMCSQAQSGPCRRLHWSRTDVTSAPRELSRIETGIKRVHNGTRCE